MHCRREGGIFCFTLPGFGKGAAGMTKECFLEELALFGGRNLLSCAA